jgi:long-chain-fatty-acid--[acyl-carrier-protein] ligase
LNEFVRAVKEKQGPILFLPNHTAQLDPMIIYSYFWPRFRMRALAVEYMYRMPVIGDLIRISRGIPIPNFDTGINQYKIHKARLAMDLAQEGMREGDNFLIFPAGRTKLTGKEVIGGSSSAHDLVREIPELSLGIIRISGLWGSAFSKGLDGKIPDPFKTLVRGFVIGLKNLIFFTPRRHIYIDIELNPAEICRTGTRVEFNRSLEDWYNRYLDDGGVVHQIEPLKQVSYSAWKEVYPPVTTEERSFDAELPEQLPDGLEEGVKEAIREIVQNPTLQISREMTLGPDLGMDSLNIAELIAFMAQNYDTEEVNPDQVTTVRAILLLARGVKAEKVSLEREEVHSKSEEPSRPYPAHHEGRTFQEVFLDLCDRMGSHVAFVDPMSGELSYKKCKRAIFVLAQYFKTLPEQHVGVMLPSSAAVYLSILALQFAGKTPVMLNWTLGPRYLEQMMEASGAKRVVTSWRFIEKLPYAEFGSLIEKFEFLEDIRQNLSLKQKLTGALLAAVPSKLALRVMNLDRIDENEAMVILFTSGTENMPKGVPLSHRNVLTDIHDSMLNFYASVTPKDAMFSMLPPFHSFGFTASGFMPLFSGIRVICFPDPTDNFGIAKGIEHWEATYTCSTPSFLKRLLQTAKIEKLRSLRWIFLGGEKAPQELHDKLPGVSLIEGYGVTECSPILTIRKLDRKPLGVGQPLKRVEIRTIHPETHHPLPEGSEGEICVCGPTVFNGYLNGAAAPFIELDEKRWYRTGDMGRLDESQTLHLTGRLKRFIKVAGEMISLGAVEGALIQELLKQGVITPDLPAIAICSQSGGEEKDQLVLFSTIHIDKEKANLILKECGFSRLIKIGSVKKVEEIPLMGTGKTNYRALQSLIC